MPVTALLLAMIPLKGDHAWTPQSWAGPHAWRQVPLKALLLHAQRQVPLEAGLLFAWTPQGGGLQDFVTLSLVACQVAQVAQGSD